MSVPHPRHGADPLHGGADRSAHPRSGAPRSRGDYAGRALKLIGVLKGSVFFLTALARHIEVPVKVDFLASPVFPTRAARPAWCASPKTWTRASKATTCCWWRTSSIPASRCATCCRRWPAGRPTRSHVCTFLDRNSRRIVQAPVDFRCFEIPDRFVVGFGLDSQPALPQPGLCRGDEARKGLRARLKNYTPGSRE